MPAPPHEPGGRGRVRPSGRFELWAWLFMRISGLVLLVLAVGHVLIMHVFDEGVDRVDFAFIQLRWASLFWKSWDWLMLVLALLHGVNGLRVIVLDYVRPARARTAINGTFTVLGAALMVLGTVIVVTFDPAKWPGAS
jgi:succinate dehydrogenase / fumarate reductase membrane anchor subunit